MSIGSHTNIETEGEINMNFKKAMMASMIISSLCMTLAGPISVEAVSANEQQKKIETKKFNIDKKLAAKLQKAVEQYAGKTIKLENVGTFQNLNIVVVQSTDGKYGVEFESRQDKIWNVYEKIKITEVSKKLKDDILKNLKKAYPNKKYVFNNEVVKSQYYNNSKSEISKEYITYNLNGEDFQTVAITNPVEREAHIRVTIQVDKKDIDPKMLKTAQEAIKTVFDHQFDVNKAQLESGWTDREWTLQDDTATVYMLSGKPISIVNEQGNKVTTSKELTEKEVKEVVAPLAKQVFNVDISEYAVKWDSLFKDYRFVNKEQTTVVRAALDADKNLVYIKTGGRAAAGN